MKKREAESRSSQRADRTVVALRRLLSATDRGLKAMEEVRAARVELARVVEKR